MGESPGCPWLVPAPQTRQACIVLALRGRWQTSGLKGQASTREMRPAVCIMDRCGLHYIDHNHLAGATHECVIDSVFKA